MRDAAHRVIIPPLEGPYPSRLPLLPMKKLFPLRGYFIRARVFGFIVLFIGLVYLVYFILDLLEL